MKIRQTLHYMTSGHDRLVLLWPVSGTAHVQWIYHLLSIRVAEPRNGVSSRHKIGRVPIPIPIHLRLWINYAVFR